MKTMNNTENLDIDLSEFPKDILIRMILFAHENDLTFNESIIKLLKDNLPKLNLEDENQLPLL